MVMSNQHVLNGGILILAIGLSGLEGCGSGGGPAAHVEVIRSQVSRDKTSDATPEEVASSSAGLQDFAFDVYGKLCESNENICVSPYSLSRMLSMPYAGAESETAEEMAKVLYFKLPPERTHAVQAAIDRGLLAQGGKYQLEVSNAYWAQAGLTLRQTFLDTLARHYGVDGRLVDFRGNMEGSRVAINTWAREATHGKIPELLDRDVLTVDTVLVLVNAVYFKANWKHPFQRNGDMPFTTLDGKEVSVPRMKVHFLFDYLRTDEFQAVRLPYLDPSIEMLIIMPEPSHFRAVERLDGMRFSEISKRLGEKPFHGTELNLPKFKFSFATRLKKPLIELGMVRAFSQAADFSGISDARLMMSLVVQQAMISVDEVGTEAAAATAGGAVPVSAPPPSLWINRPFVFVIRDKRTDTMLFLGRVADPSK